MAVIQAITGQPVHLKVSFPYPEDGEEEATIYIVVINREEPDLPAPIASQA